MDHVGNYWTDLTLIYLTLVVLAANTTLYVVIIIKFSLSVCLFVSMLIRNRLPNHAYYGDEAFAGDSSGSRIRSAIKFYF